MRLLLSCQPFRTLWAAGLISSLGGWALGIAVSVHVYDVTASPLATSGLLVAGSAPAISLGSIGGVVADRFPPSRLLVVVGWWRALIVGGLWFGFGSDLLWCYAVVALQAGAMQFFGPAEQVAVAGLVARDDVPAAVASNSVATNLTRLVGPALGGALVGVAGFATTVVVVAAMLALAAVLLGRLPGGGGARAARDAPFHRDWGEGFRQFRKERTLRAIAALQLLDACKEGPYSGLFPVLMLGVVGTSPTFMGIVNSSFAVTAMIAGGLCAPVVRRCGYRVPIAAGASTAGLLLLLLVGFPCPAVALLAVSATGFPFTVSWVASGTLLLLSSSPDHRGRAVGVMGSAYAATLLLSAAVAGVAAEEVGSQAVLAVAASLEVAAGPVFLLMTRTSPPAGAGT